MKYYYNLYRDDVIMAEEHYLIVLSANNMNHLEILHSVLFEQRCMTKDNLFVVGLAKGYAQALEVVEKITQEVYDKTNGVDIRNYILKTQQEYEEGNV